MNLFDLCLDCKTIPKDWLLARVTLIFKKGDPACCHNYGPICLTTAAYKIFATLLSGRLQAAGVEDKLWKSQFGFRRGRSTTDAIYVARRVIELACAQRHGQIQFLALDWRKAFDSVAVDALLDALRQFGLPTDFGQMVSALMLNREFFVEECGHKQVRHKIDEVWNHPRMYSQSSAFCHCNDRLNDRCCGVAPTCVSRSIFIGDVV